MASIMLMSLVHNERIKLTAAAIDRISTATLVGGFFGPIATTFTSTAAVDDFGLRKMLVFSAFSIIVSILLHFGARRILRGLKS